MTAKLPFRIGRCRRSVHVSAGGSSRLRSSQHLCNHPSRTEVASDARCALVCHRTRHLRRRPVRCARWSPRPRMASRGASTAETSGCQQSGARLGVRRADRPGFSSLQSSVATRVGARDSSSVPMPPSSSTGRSIPSKGASGLSAKSIEVTRDPADRPLRVELGDDSVEHLGRRTRGHGPRGPSPPREVVIGPSVTESHRSLIDRFLEPRWELSLHNLVARPGRDHRWKIAPQRHLILRHAPEPTSDDAWRGKAARSPLARRAALLYRGSPIAAV
ncbi:MAG: hypothetical protein JWR90_3678 [Marmoricola sp.]|nr:hypothetical protein [Marmoricola sp.]